MVGRIQICSVSFLLMFLAFTIFCPVASASQGSAQHAISAAQDTIKTCIDAVQQAEGAGANVDTLMSTLNDSAALLSKAQLAYASNDYDSAYTYATQSQSKLNDFTHQAKALAQTALAVSEQTATPMLLSIVCSVVILCGGIAAWAVLSKKERRNLHGSTTV